MIDLEGVLEDAGVESLDEVKADLFDVLDNARAEVPVILSALRDGRINGATYGGECSCVIGTVARARGCEAHDLDDIWTFGLRPSEYLVHEIELGDTPANNLCAAIVETWIVEWMAKKSSPIRGETMTETDFRTLAAIAKRAGANFIQLGRGPIPEEIVSRHPNARSRRHVYIGGKMIQCSEVDVDGILIESSTFEQEATTDELAQIPDRLPSTTIDGRRPGPEIETVESEDAA